MVESGSESHLVPAVNLKNVGTIRDARKWPIRDRRKDSRLLDQINFKLLNPYTVGKIIAGRNILLDLRKSGPGDGESYRYGNMIIRPSSADKGIELYQAAIDKYLGKVLVKRIANSEFKTVSELRRILAPVGIKGRGEWVDLAGLLTPKSEVENLISGLEKGRYGTAGELSDAFRSLNMLFPEWEWTWCCEKIEEETGVPVEKFTPADVAELIVKWKKSIEDFDNMIYADAAKEFNAITMTGFGIDGDEADKNSDFKAVRGDFLTNSEVSAIKVHTSLKKEQGDELINRLKSVK
jgi:hypothetical protein